MKAEVYLIKEKIELYLNNFDPKQLISLDFEEKEVFSDVIFIKK